MPKNASNYAHYRNCGCLGHYHDEVFYAEIPCPEHKDDYSKTTLVVCDPNA